MVADTRHLNGESGSALLGPMPAVDIPPAAPFIEAGSPHAPVNLLPGPVSIAGGVCEALAAPAVSHRAAAFKESLRQTRRELCNLTKARHTAILVGTGTLANDVIAAQLALQSGEGLILANGEFGERLVDHARRARLSFTVLKANWGSTFETEQVTHALAQQPALKWLWAVHCETSTGVLNDIDTLRDLTAQREVRLCLDCISSIGTVPVDLRDVYLASGVSGKGLGGFPGLAMVFFNHAVSPSSQIPRYLDLGLYADEAGCPFTHSSNLVAALHAAVCDQDTRDYECKRELAAWLRAALLRLGACLVAADEVAAPAVVTIALPHTLNSRAVGDWLADRGYLLSYESDYLLQRNWIQICTMGQCTRAHLEPLLLLLSEFL